jgi:hypothetical protein
MTLKELTHLVENIRDNHLVHLKEDVDRVEKKVEKMDNRVWAILIILVSAVVIPQVIEFIRSVPGN